MADPTVPNVQEVANLTSTSGVQIAIDVALNFVASTLTGSGLSQATLDYIALYLACHFAVLTAQKGPMMEDRIGEVTERYHNIYGKGLLATRFGQQAIALDTTGTLSALASSVTNPTLKAKFEIISPAPFTDAEEDDILP